MTLSGSLRVRRLGVAVSALTLGLGMATPVHAVPAEDTVDCIEYGDVAEAPAGSIPRDDLHRVRRDPLAQSLEAATSSRSTGGKPGGPDTTRGTIVIPVRFHVISKDTGRTGGNVSDARVAAQIAVLNDAYDDWGFSFDLVETTRTIQPEWFNLVSANGATPRYYRGSGKEVRMKKALYGGSTSETLNIYTASLAQFLLGWAYFPSDFDEAATNGNPLPSYLDGVVVDYRSMPTVPGDTGDSAVYSTYGDGDTATHEVGHWLELYHTFQGGCEGDGDFVDDTAAEASPAFRCEEGRDTCPDQAGDDPITNFMDYTPDACMDEFTAGQAARMQEAWATYRAT